MVQRLMRVKTIFLLTLLFLLGSQLQVFGQNVELIISKSPDFSTADRDFEFTDTLYVMLRSDDIDYTKIDDIDFKLKARQGESQIEGHFENHFNGSYTAKIALAEITEFVREWVLTLKVEDNLGNRFSIQLPILIGDDNGDLSDGEIVFEFSGRIGEIQGDSLFVHGIWITLTDSTKLFDHDRNEITFADLFVGLKARIVAILHSDSTITAKYIKVELNEDFDSKFELEGFITDLDSSHVTVQGLTFLVTDETEIRAGRQEELTLADLDSNMFVVIRGELLEDGTPWAKHIRVKKENREEKFEISGTIESVTDSTIVVSGYELFLYEGTEIRARDWFEIGRAALMVGAEVEVYALKHEDGKLWARKIKIEEIPGVEVEVEGEIHELGDGFIVVNGADFHVTDKTLVVTDERERGDFSNLQLGMLVKVKGLELEDGRMFALLIMAKKHLSERIKKRGHIQALTENSLTVLETTFLVDSTTRVYDESNNELLFSDLRLEMRAKVKGFKFNDGRVFAEKIKVLNQAVEELEVRAEIDSLGDYEIYAAGLVFKVLDITIIVNELRDRLEFSDLQVGNWVHLKALRLADGSVFAKFVKVKTEAEEHHELRGTIVKIAGDTVFVEETALLTNAKTEYYDRDENFLALADFVEGDFVRAKAVQDEEGNWVAKKLQQLEAAAVQGLVEDSGATNGNTSNGSLAKQAVILAQFQLANTLILVDENTFVVGKLNDLLDASNITSGMVVDVEGTLNSSGELLASTVQVLDDTGVTGISTRSSTAQPEAFALDQNYPNPFNPSTTLQFSIYGSEAQEVVLSIYNLLGQKVLKMVDEVRMPGIYSVTWNGLDQVGQQVSSGIYWARLSVGDKIQVRRLLLNK